MRGRQLDLQVCIDKMEKGEGRLDPTIPARALVDSGCTGSCIDEAFVNRHAIPTRKYIRPIGVFNADGTPNEAGIVTHYATVGIEIQGHQELLRLAVTKLASSDLFLGYDWLMRHNPDIDWAKATLEFTRCPGDCGWMNVEWRK